MNTYFEPGLSRAARRPKIDWAYLFKLLAFYLAIFAAGLAILMLWGYSHAHAQGYAGIIKDGQILTAEQFCNHV